MTLKLLVFLSIVLISFQFSLVAKALTIDPSLKGFWRSTSCQETQNGYEYDYIYISPQDDNKIHLIRQFFFRF